MSEQIIPVRYTKEYQQGYAEGFTEGRNETLKYYEKTNQNLANPVTMVTDEATAIFEANLKAQKIVIDKYIAENKKLKEALKDYLKLLNIINDVDPNNLPNPDLFAKEIEYVGQLLKE